MFSTPSPHVETESQCHQKRPEDSTRRRVRTPISRPLCLEQRFLPWSSVRGSSNNRKLNVDKGMAMAYKHGVPTVFITMTCNPSWEEIRDNLPPGQRWYHCLNIVNRVFEQKLQALITACEKAAFLIVPAGVFQDLFLAAAQQKYEYGSVIIADETFVPATHMSQCVSPVEGTTWRCLRSKKVWEPKGSRCHSESGTSPTNRPSRGTCREEGRAEEAGGKGN